MPRPSIVAFDVSSVRCCAVASALQTNEIPLTAVLSPAAGGRLADMTTRALGEKATSSINVEVEMGFAALVAVAGNIPQRPWADATPVPATSLCAVMAPLQLAGS